MTLKQAGEFTDAFGERALNVPFGFGELVSPRLKTVIVKKPPFVRKC
jgi:hypothetical protein